MIKKQVDKMIQLSVSLKEAILLDIEDVKMAQHENLLTRNDYKLELIQNISEAQEELNQLLIEAIQNEQDVEQYREIVEELEVNLTQLYELNGKLASIVLPVKQMYKQIIDDISDINGGALFEVRA